MGVTKSKRQQAKTTGAPAPLEPRAVQDETDAAPDLPRKRGRPRGVRRDVILREASRLFLERGFTATSIDDIGEAAGVTGPAVYRHFKSKDELLVTLVNESADRSEEEIRRIHEKGGTPAEMLQELVRSQVRQAAEQAQTMILAGQESHNLSPDLRQRVQRRDRMNREEWAHLVAQVRTDLDDAEVRAMVLGLKYLLYGVVNRRAGLREERMEELACDMLLGAIWAGYGAHAPTGSEAVAQVNPAE